MGGSLFSNVSDQVKKVGCKIQLTGFGPRRFVTCMAFINAGVPNRRVFFKDLLCIRGNNRFGYRLDRILGPYSRRSRLNPFRLWGLDEAGGGGDKQTYANAVPHGQFFSVAFSIGKRQMSRRSTPLLGFQYYSNLSSRMILPRFKSIDAESSTSSHANSSLDCMGT